MNRRMAKMLPPNLESLDLKCYEERSFSLLLDNLKVVMVGAARHDFASLKSIIVRIQIDGLEDTSSNSMEFSEYGRSGMTELEEMGRESGIELQWITRMPSL